MKKLLVLFSASAFMLVSCNNDNATKEAAPTDTVTAAPTDKPAPPAPPDSATMMKAWMAYMTPGDMQKALAKMDGNWTEETTMWMDPNKPPTISKGSMEAKMILGGRYHQGMHHGNFNGMPFEGISTWAYDNAKKVFLTTWIDNMGTGIMTMEGTWDDASKTFSFKGKGVDPVSGNDMDCRQTMKMDDDTHMTMEMFMTPAPGAPEMKNMEIKYTKK
jgi:hypothetical protein